MFPRNGKRIGLRTALALLPLLLASFPRLAQAQQLQYAVKFMCGIPGVEADREAVKSGNYATAINIHNPSTTGIDLRKKAVQALPQGVPPVPPSPFKGDTLGPDGALEVDCANIRDLLQLPPPVAPFIKGFLVILSPRELDVWGVYTAEQPPPTPGGGIALEIVGPVPPRQVLPGSVPLPAATNGRKNNK